MNRKLCGHMWGLYRPVGNCFINFTYFCYRLIKCNNWRYNTCIYTTDLLNISLNCWINICRFYNILHSSFSWSFIYEVYLTFKRFICRYRVLLFYCNEFFRKIEITFSFKSLFLPFPQTFVNILYADPDELFGAIIIIWSLDSTQQKSQNFPYDLKSINI